MKYLLFLLLPFLVFCGSGDERQAETTQITPATGLELFAMPAKGGNFYSCSRCHSPTKIPEGDEQRPGHDLENAFYRTNFKNGQLSTLLDAVNSCREDWMFAPKYTKDSPDWKTFESYLKGLSDGSSTDNLTFNIIQPPATLPAGDAVAGKEFFNTNCAICHGMDGFGGFATTVAGTKRSAEFIAKKIRLSGNPDSKVYSDLTAGGPMPFYAADKISDQQIADVIQFIVSEPTPAPAPTPAPTPSTGSDSDVRDISSTSANLQSNCSSTHPNVGKTLTLANKSFHNVNGTARIIDDCTIQIDDFTYDGFGIVVEFYTGQNNNFRSGTSISRSLLGPAFTGDSVSIKLPVGVSLDSFDSLSVWCVRAEVDFGSGQFN